MGRPKAELAERGERKRLWTRRRKTAQTSVARGSFRWRRVKSPSQTTPVLSQQMVSKWRNQVLRIGSMACSMAALWGANDRRCPRRCSSRDCQDARDGPKSCAPLEPSAAWPADGLVADGRSAASGAPEQPHRQETFKLDRSFRRQGPRHRRAVSDPPLKATSMRSARGAPDAVLPLAPGLPSGEPMTSLAPSSAALDVATGDHERHPSAIAFVPADLDIHHLLRQPTATGRRSDNFRFHPNASASWILAERRAGPTSPSLNSRSHRQSYGIPADEPNHFNEFTTHEARAPHNPTGG